MRSLGSQVKAARGAMRQELVCQLAEIGPTFLSNIETGHANPTAECLVAILKATGGQIILDGKTKIR